VSGEVFAFGVDPEELARFGGDDPALTRLIEGTAEDADAPEDQRFEQLIVPLLGQLPPREADIIELYYCQKKRQLDIGLMLGLTQAGVSYRLKRAAERLHFLLSIPKLSDAEVTESLRRYFEPDEMQILLTYRATSSQSATGKLLGLYQEQVRARLFKYLKKMQEWRETDPSLADVTRLFEMLIDRHNILHAVSQPQWENRGPGERDDRFG